MGNELTTNTKYTAKNTKQDNFNNPKF